MLVRGVGNSSDPIHSMVNIGVRIPVVALVAVTSMTLLASVAPMYCTPILPYMGIFYRPGLGGTHVLYPILPYMGIFYRHFSRGDKHDPPGLGGRPVRAWCNTHCTEYRTVRAQCGLKVVLRL